MMSTRGAQHRQRNRSDDVASIESLHAALFGHDPSSEKDCEVLINEWVRDHQPCLFGRRAAAQNRLAIKMNRVGEGMPDPQAIGLRVRHQVDEWCNDVKRDTVGLLILIASEHIAHVERSSRLRAWCASMVEAVSGGVSSPNEAFTVNIKFHANGSAWAWPAPVNLFLTALEGTRWRNRFIPGGVALSINSIGLFQGACPTDRANPRPLSPSVVKLLDGTLRLSSPAIERVSPSVFTSDYPLDAILPADFFADVGQHPETASACRPPYINSVPLGLAAAAEGSNGQWSDASRHIEQAVRV